MQPKAKRNSAYRSHSPWALVLATSLLGACGGGSGSAGNTTSPTTQVALGAVSGFGSVYIDGVRYDDSESETAIEDANGNRIAAKLELGQRVRALHDGQGKATRLLVEAAVVGDVAAVDATAGTLTVAAQSVRINTDPGQGPVTRFGGGYESLASVVLGNPVEIHGSPVYDSAAQRYEIRATRVAKLDSRSHYRVSGSTSSVDADSFSINGLTVAYTADAIKPAGAALSDGASVVVFGTQMTGTTLNATAVRVLRAQADAPAASTQVALGGFISAWNGNAGQFVVDGQSVRLGTVTPTPAGATPQVGAYVKVVGLVAADGLIDASAVNIRTPAAEDELAMIRLAGEITDLIDGSAFLVRGVPIDATGITPTAGCPSPLVDGTLVQIKARAQAGTDVVRALEIQCAATQSMRPREVADRGLLWPVNRANQTFGLTDARSNQPVTVRWDDKTVFLGLPKPGSSELEIQVIRSVYVEGYQQGDTLVARVVRDVTAAAGKRDSDRFRRDPGAPIKPQPWLSYQQRPAR